MNKQGPRGPTEAEMKALRLAVLFAACTQVNLWSHSDGTSKWEKQMEQAQRSLTRAVNRYWAAVAILERGKSIL